MQAETDPNAPTNSGDMPKPNAYPVHSQRDEGKAIGIQAEMGKEPITVKQEGKDGYELYKPAGKVGTSVLALKSEIADPISNTCVVQFRC